MITKEQLLREIADIGSVKTSDLSFDNDFKTLIEWDSMCDLSLVAALDEKFGIHISGDALDNATTITELYEFLT